MNSQVLIAAFLIAVTLTGCSIAAWRYSRIPRPIGREMPPLRTADSIEDELQRILRETPL